MGEIIKKICSKCKIEKLLDDFHNDKKSKDGKVLWCKLCKHKHTKKYYSDNREKKLQYTKEYNIKNKEKIKGADKKRNKIYRDKNKEKIQEKVKLYKEANKEKIIQSNKRYREENKEFIKTSKQKYKTKMLKTNSFYRLKHNIGNLIRHALKTNNFKKNTKTINILGCNYNEFKNHLESKFESWMSWDNYGLYNGELNYGWDIDHIIPISEAKTEEDILELNHYTNLQPLCSYANRHIKRDIY